MDVTTSSADEGVGSSCEIAPCARTGAPPQGSIATKPVNAIRNTIPINAAGLRPVNPTANRPGSMRMITILLSESLSPSTHDPCSYAYSLKITAARARIPRSEINPATHAASDRGISMSCFFRPFIYCQCCTVASARETIPMVIINIAK